MRLCIPVASNQGLDSQVHGHFGSAPLYVVVDTETQEVTPVDNENDHSLHGTCAPVGLIAGLNVEAVVVGGIGRGAVNRFLQSGIKVYLARPGSVFDTLVAFKEGELGEVSQDGTCQGHGCGH